MQRSLMRSGNGYYTVCSINVADAVITSGEQQWKSLRV
jgi:hypothetical protein